MAQSAHSTRRTQSAMARAGPAAQPRSQAARPPAWKGSRCHLIPPCRCI